MSYALNTTKTIIAAVALAILVPSVGMAETMQIDSAVNVIERSSTGRVTDETLSVHIVDDGNMVINHDESGSVAFLMRPAMVAELDALFKKGAEWGATAKENKVEIQKEIGKLTYNKKNKLTAIFFSCRGGESYFIVIKVEMGYKDATFFLEPGVPAQIMSRLHKAPEVKAELEAVVAAKAEKSKLFN